MFCFDSKVACTTVAHKNMLRDIKFIEFIVDEQFRSVAAIKNKFNFPLFKIFIKSY